MKILIQLLFFSFTNIIFSQSTVVFSEKQSKKENIYKIFPENDSNYITITYKALYNLKSDTTFYINRYKNFKLVQTSEISSKIGSENIKIESIIKENDLIYVFKSLNSGKEKNVYLEKYDQNFKNIGEAKKVLNFSSQKKFSKKDKLIIISSENNEYFVVCAVLKGLKNEYDKIVYNIFNKNLDIVSSGSHFLSYPSEKISSSTFKLSNDAKFLILAKVFKFQEGFQLFEENDNILTNKIIIYQFEKNQIFTSELALKNDIYLSNLNIAEKYDKIIILGLKSSKDDGSSEALAYFAYDLVKKNFYFENHYELKTEVIKSYWNRIVAEKDKKLFHFKIHSVKLLSNGELMVFLEQNYKVIEKVDVNATNNSSYYYSNDILIYKFNFNNDLIWETKIDKYQKSHNDDGYYSSFVYTEKENKLLFYFNDNIGNYNTVGEYFQCQASADFATNSNVFAQIEMDIKSAEQVRKILFKKREVEQISVPKYAFINPEKQEIILYLSFLNFEKFGIINY